MDKYKYSLYTKMVVSFTDQYDEISDVVRVLAYPALDEPPYDGYVEYSMEEAVVLIQDCIDLNFPNSSVMDLQEEALLESLTPLDVHVDNLVFPTIALVNKYAPREMLRSLVRSARPPPLRATFETLSEGLMKRNCLAIPQENHSDCLVKASRMVESFLSYFCVPDVEQRCLEFRQSPVMIQSGRLAEWISRLSVEKTRRIEAMLDAMPTGLDDLELDRYSLDLKKRIKTVVSDAASTKKSRAQTIHAHGPVEIAAYSPVMQALQSRMEEILLPQIALPIGRSVSAMNAHISFVLRDLSVRGLYKHGVTEFIESDISAFDRSQKLSALYATAILMEQLGMDREMGKIIHKSTLEQVTGY